MGLEAVWQQAVAISYPLWVWLSYEASVHPFLFLGVAVVIVSAWVLYKMEVRSR
jgi:hypothetical protein